jgi:hypothetical protein
MSDSIAYLTPNSPDECPIDPEDVWDYVRREAADGDNSRRELLRFVRTAEIDGSRLWLWTYTESDGEVCYVYAHQRENGQQLLALLSSAGRKPESFLSSKRSETSYGGGGRFMKQRLNGAAMKRVPAAIAIATLALSLGGCALGVTKVDVAHSPLTGVMPKQEGSVLVKQFVDGRQSGHRQYIGNKRNGFGMVLGSIGTQDGVSLEALLTRYFMEALQHAGYNAVLQPSASATSDSVFDAVLQGEIKEFWLDLYMATWHSVDVSLKLKDKPETHVLWERDIRGEKTNVLWLGLSSEFEKVIREALDAAMDQAVKEFGSAEFQAAVKRGNVPPGAAAATEPRLAR